MSGVLPASGDLQMARDAAPAAPRQQFRTFLIDRVTTAHALQFYVDQAIPQFAHDTEVRLAVEELIDHTGRLLGFSVERAQEREWSVWTLPDMARLVVTVGTPAAAASGISQFARRRDDTSSSDDASPAGSITGLVVVCGSGNRRLLDDAVTIRRAADRVRLITAEALLRLVAHARSGRASQAQILTVLRPARAFADPLVDLFDS